ncbi:MAG: hypothetical protein ACRD4X_11260 [Candidatus Acidiferrales bacterium]
MSSRSVCLALAVCAFACISGPAWAGRSKALGSVAQTNNALIDNDTAMAGANVYACDVLDTDNYGDLRVQFHGSQIALGTTSEVVLDGSPDAVRVIVIEGSVSFSAPSSAQLIIDTPAGTLREASGQAYTGTVTIAGPKELVVSAVRGDIALNNGGALDTIPAGKSARLTFDQAADASCHSPGYVRSTTNSRKIGFYILGGAVAGGAGYAIWHDAQESPTRPE